MRMTLLSIFVMSVTTLGSAVFFIQTMEKPSHLGGPLLGKYAAAWRTAQRANPQAATKTEPLTNVTIINAPAH